MIVLVKDPSYSIQGTSNVSYMNAVHNPINFKFKRVDYTIASIANNGGNAQLVFSLAFDTGDFAVGSKVRVIGNDLNGVFEVLTIDSTTEITLDTPFTTTAGVELVTFERKNWICELLLYAQNEQIGLGKLVATISDRDGLDSTFTFNVAPFLKKFMLTQLGLSTLGVDFKESLIYRFECKEYYNGEYQSEYESENDYWAMNSAMQSRNIGSGNMQRFMYGDSTKKLSFISGFERPTHFCNYPNPNTWLYFGFEKTGLNLQYKALIKDVNGNVLTTNHYDIEGNIEDQNCLVRTILNTNPITLDGLMQDGGTLEITVVTLAGMVETAYSNKLICDVHKRCATSPVYLMWLDTNGGFDHWLFERVQTIQIETENRESFEPRVVDLETQIGDIFEIKNTNSNLIVLTAYVPIDKVEGIKSMLYSINVEMLLNPETWYTDTGLITEQVRPVKGSFSLYNTTDTYTELTVTIERITTNIQSR